MRTIYNMKHIRIYTMLNTDYLNKFSNKAFEKLLTNVFKIGVLILIKSDSNIALSVGGGGKFN